MKEKIGVVFNISEDNQPVPGCTLSECIHDGVCGLTYFSLAADTDISAEIYSSHKLIYVASGGIEITGGTVKEKVSAGEAIILPVDVPVGMAAKVNSVYTELSFAVNSDINKAVEIGKPFILKELAPSHSGKIINMDLVRNKDMKLAVMSFGAGTGLSEHAAPGEAMIFALEGKAVIIYEGREHTIHAGENFCFAKRGRHAVRADADFKMALLLMLE